jgi:hypothetical protein
MDPKMTSEIVVHLSPEERELAQKRFELALLQGELADRELYLASLRAELAAFESRYLREVGTLYAELDDWNAKIAELSAKAADTAEARTAAAEARARADQSYAGAHADAENAEFFTPSAELKKLFKEIVNRIHPDRATNEADRILRERLMAEANLAYRRQDIDTLGRILDEYKTSPESVVGDGVAADLERIVRQVERIKVRLACIEIEVAALTSSDIALLMAKEQAARKTGRNLLDEMAKDLWQRIAIARSEFDLQLSQAKSI